VAEWMARQKREICILAAGTDLCCCHDDFSYNLHAAFVVYEMEYGIIRTAKVGWTSKLLFASFFRYTVLECGREDFFLYRSCCLGGDCLGRCHCFTIKPGHTG